MCFVLCVDFIVVFFSMSISLFFSFSNRQQEVFIFFVCLCFVCVCMFFSQILHNHRGMFFFYFFEIFSARPFFCCFWEKMLAIKPRPLFFLIMTMKTSSIILCIFFSIEPLTVNCAYFRKKSFVFMGAASREIWRVKIWGGFWETFGREFCSFFKLK